MRIFDIYGNEIENPDMSLGYFSDFLCLKKKESESDPDEYEDAYVYNLYADEPDFVKKPHHAMVELADLSSAVISISEAIAEQDEAMIALYESMIGE